MKKLSFFLMAMLFSVMSFAADVTISFANANHRLSQDGNSQVWQNSGVTFTNAKANSTSAVVGNTNPIRCYANSKITVEAPGTITKLVFDCNNGSYATALKNSVGQEASVSNDIVTITPTTASNTYVIAKLTAQVRIDKLTVTYTESGVAETVVANPIFSLAGGEYEGAQTVKISCTTADATIYYTINGDVPSTSSNVYSDPITISENTTIKAYAVKNGLEDSEVVEATYTITEGPDAIIDFTSNSAWNFPAEYDKTQQTYSNGTYSIVVHAASNGHKYSGSQLLLGKKDAYLVLPAFSQPIEKIACPAVSGSSGKVTWNIYDGANAVSKEVTACNIDQVFKIDNPAANKAYTIKITNDNNLQISHIKIYFGEAAAVAKPYINGDAEFIESTEVTISAEDGLKVYYTLDGTDPTNASTEYTAPFELTATTTVKAVAYDGETASEVSSKTFKAITLLTCKEAAELALSVANNNDLVPNGPYAFRGFVTNIAYAYQTGGTMSVWMADTKNGGKVMQAYKFTPEDGNNPPVVGDYLQVVGELTKYNTTPESAAGAIVTKYPAPVVKYTVTLSDNTGGFEPLTSGDGEYEEGEEVTVYAVDSEGWVFVGWMDENGDIVSNDYQYTFVIEGNVELVAIYAQLMELEVNDLQIITEPVFGLLGSAELMPGMTLSFELIVDDSEQGDDGEYYLTENSKVYLNDETELEFLEGIALIDMESKIAQAQVLAAMGETLYLFNLDMSAAPAEPVDLVVTDATIYEEDEILFLTAPWEGKTIKAELPATEHQGWMMIEIHEGEDFSIAMSQNATIATVDNVLTITGVFTDNFTGDIYNVNISGKLPVVEPTTITYELNGGVLPAPAVPTQEELWASFKTAAGLTTLGTLVEITEAGAGKPHNDQNNPCACRIICAKLLDANVNAVFALPEWAWLKAYIMTVQSGLPEISSAAWRYAFAAFFLQSEHSAYPASADFTEAGKPEVWGAAYQAANELVLPTEPVAEDYVLPTPVKEGCKFVGWYDNAAGTGEAYTVIPAGWAGTLYAIWEVEGPATALENIAVEGKAVKAIVNGQLIIIKNGVQYNAQGQVVK